MKYVVRKTKLADADSLKAAAWYDEQRPGLGEAFFDDLDVAIDLLAKNPLIYSIRFADIRCIRLRRFATYGVFYIVRDPEIWILAVHHGSRHPAWLQKRRRQFGDQN